ncbi:MAG: UDP-N-acetylmuramate dehydrogenase [Nitrospirae bacterium]|nr:UDP-N-acetylmuramate dehydrogenase [Nitrospirota bacterium]
MIQQVSERRIKEMLAEGFSAGDASAGEPMKNHTTLRIGGPADLYVAPKSLSSLRDVLALLCEEGIAAMPVGGGSNILVADEGIEGAVVSTRSFNRIEIIEEDGDEVRLFVEAGTLLRKLVSLSAEKGYEGVEGLAGIPGFVGGALRGNAGSFGCAIGDVVETATFIDVEGRTASRGREVLSFGYRTSAIPAGSVIVGAHLRVRKGEPDSITKKTEDCLREKMRKQPVAKLSAGCVFKNPPGAHAGRLIDEAGCKGMRRGDVEVSSLHANFFINRGDGTASQFLGLMEDVKERVMKSFGAELEPEIRIVGGRGLCR